jgi:ElaB/YqjD/DUF883 family membrane-anchored ribosome-binding protein
MNASAKSTTVALADSAHGAVNSVRDAANDAIDRGSDALSQASRNTAVMADSASKQITTFASELSKMTRENPLAAVAGAAMAGVLVGLLIRGRQGRE